MVEIMCPPDLRRNAPIRPHEESIAHPEVQPVSFACEAAETGNGDAIDRPSESRDEIRFGLIRRLQRYFDSPEDVHEFTVFARGQIEFAKDNSAAAKLRYSDIARESKANRATEDPVGSTVLGERYASALSSDFGFPREIPGHEHIARSKHSYRC